MKKIKNMTELELFKQKLKYREMLFEKELVGATADITHHFTDILKDFTFDFGMRIFRYLFSSKKQEENSG